MCFTYFVVELLFLVPKWLNIRIKYLAAFVREVVSVVSYELSIGSYGLNT